MCPGAGGAGGVRVCVQVARRVCAHRVVSVGAPCFFLVILPLNNYTYLSFWCERSIGNLCQTYLCIYYVNVCIYWFSDTVV